MYFFLFVTVLSLFCYWCTLWHFWAAKYLYFYPQNVNSFWKASSDDRRTWSHWENYQRKVSIIWKKIRRIIKVIHINLPKQSAPRILQEFWHNSYRNPWRIPVGETKCLWKSKKRLNNSILMERIHLWRILVRETLCLWNSFGFFHESFKNSAAVCSDRNNWPIQIWAEFWPYLSYIFENSVVIWFFLSEWAEKLLLLALLCSYC